MENPYMSCVLQTNVSLYPNQLDNNIDLHLKENLIKKYEGKCYEDYGFIHKIYDITKRSVGYLIPENPTGSVTYLVDFACRICNPVVEKQIITKIVRLNNSLIKSECGSIDVINNVSKLDKTKFTITQMNEIFYKKDDEKIRIDTGSYLKILITAKTFNDNDIKITTIGNIIDVANIDEIGLFYNYEYDPQFKTE